VAGSGHETFPKMSESYFKKSAVTSWVIVVGVI